MNKKARFKLPAVSRICLNKSRVKAVAAVNYFLLDGMEGLSLCKTWKKIQMEPRVTLSNLRMYVKELV